jgi:predicted oxidoreductase
VVDADARKERVGDRSVGEMIDVAEELGADVRRARTTHSLGLGPLESPKLAKPPFAAVNVAAAVTHTLGGLRIDDQARVLDARAHPVEGVFAAGVDAGGIASGGYASGLATALVLGVTAAETIGGNS